MLIGELVRFVIPISEDELYETEDELVVSRSSGSVEDCKKLDTSSDELLYAISDELFRLS